MVLNIFHKLHEVVLVFELLVFIRFLCFLGDLGELDRRAGFYNRCFPAELSAEQLSFLFTGDIGDDAFACFYAHRRDINRLLFAFCELGIVGFDLILCGDGSASPFRDGRR